MADAVYLDYNATTPLKPAVYDVMAEAFGDVGNASAVHAYGRRARSRVETAREQVAALAGVHANQVTFTSGATESNNAVLKHFAGRRILIGATEHNAICNCPVDLELIPVDQDGLINIDAFEKMLETGPAPALISIMLVNNETGVIQPVAKLAKLAKAKHRDVFIHSDAVQAAGRIKIDFPGLYADFMSLSAHKMAGPQGVGALICAPGTPSVAFMHGGGQEKRQRAGTENVAGIAGFGKAAELAIADMAHYQQLGVWREKMERALKEAAPGCKIFGEGAPRTANTTALCMPGLPAQTQLMTLDLAGIAISSGSACSSGTFKPSRVLQAMGASEEEATSTLRISSGWNTKESDIDAFIDHWTAMVRRLLPQSEKESA
ncbi:MAG: cysteine desulfurase [Rhodospirillales bacterium]|nr:cysteine desulfurase [Rhodospirillales bacterium]MCB9996904.1 cysteine desulfurase [Rhodospirillales bacterium]